MEQKKMAGDTIFEGKGWISFHAPTATALSQLDKIEQICTYGDTESLESIQSRGQQIIIAVVHFTRLCEEAQHATWQEPTNIENDNNTTTTLEKSLNSIQKACQTIGPKEDKSTTKDMIETALDTCFENSGRLKDDLLTLEEQIC